MESHKSHVPNHQPDIYILMELSQSPKNGENPGIWTNIWRKNPLMFSELLWKILISWGHYSQYMESHNPAMFQTTHQIDV